MLRVISALFIGCLAYSLPAQGTSAPSRIVVAGGSLTEIVYALGSGNAVVGVDQTTTYPPETQTLAKVSHWQQLNVDGMLSLQPSLVMTWQDAQPQAALDQLHQAGVQVALFQRTPSTPQQLIVTIRQAANLLQKVEQGETLIAQINADLQRVQQLTAAQKTPVKVLFLLSVAGSGAMVAGKNTVADGMITLAGGKNAATHSQYRPYGGESMIAADPEVIVVTSQSIAGGLNTLAAVPGITHTSAWRQQRIVAIDQALVLGMGPRVAHAVQTLSEGFYLVP